MGFYGLYLYGPEFLIKHDIILVTVNYRLGPYGFMCLNIPQVPGNQGLKDQLMALRWVHDNIAKFGGDPHKVTISGHSAGSMSVDLHLLRDNKGQNLFNKAILESGTSFSPAFSLPHKDAPIRLASYLNFTTLNISRALQFLSLQDPLIVVQAATNLKLVFRPCVEKKFHGVEEFLNYDWVSLKKVPAVKNMPIMAGFTNQESYFFYLESGNNYPIKDLLSSTFNVNDKEFEGMDDIVRHFFYGDEKSSYDLRYVGVDILSDLTFVYPVFRSVKRFLHSGAEKVYLYTFSYVGKRNFFQYIKHTLGTGAWHGDELAYLFNMRMMINDSITAKDQMMIDCMTTMWANFVKYGDPTPITSQLLPHKWEPVVNSSIFNYININSELSIGTGILHERMNFWDLFFEANEHLQLFLLNNKN